MTLHNPDIEDLKQFAIKIIRKSGEKALSFYGKGNLNMKFDEKLITETELSLMDFFHGQLKSFFPEHQVFSDNYINDSYTHGDKRYLWIYDPLDGVANIQAGVPIWGISLALLENFWPISGLFYMPSTDDLFYALAGKKAYRDDQEIRVSTQENINDESLLLTYSRFHHYYRSTFPGKIRNFGCTAAHFCYVAMGRAEAAIIANESYQNLAAAHVIIEAAGGKIYRMNGKEVYLNEYLGENRINEHLLIASPKTYQQVLDAVHRV